MAKRRFFKKKSDEEDAIVKANPLDEAFLDVFREDWEGIRKRHAGQESILNAFFEEEKKRVFIRAGRKFAKTSTMIDIAWRFAMEHPKSVIYYGFPTIAQAIEVVWEEKRLQTCDSKDGLMQEKYVQKVDDARHIVTFVNGSYIKLIGTWAEARGRGSQPDLLIMDEIQDCSEVYLSAMEPNLAAKDGWCLMAGTPPPFRNHYHEWEDRISSDDRGISFRYSSYSNTALPHLEDWLNKKREELYKAGRQDEWLREYMAEDCFTSANRILPDPVIQPIDDFKNAIERPAANDQQVVAIFSHFKYFVVLYAILKANGELLVIDVDYKKQIYDISHKNIATMISYKEVDYYRSIQGRKRKVMFDPSKSMRDTFPDFYEARKDMKWGDRGIPILREMMLSGKIRFSEKIADFGVECQKLLMDTPDFAIIDKFPLASALAMTVNEFFSTERMMHQEMPDDIYQPLREAGFYIPPKKKRRNPLTWR